MGYIWYLVLPFEVAGPTTGSALVDWPNNNNYSPEDYEEGMDWEEWLKDYQSYHLENYYRLHSKKTVYNQF